MAGGTRILSRGREVARALARSSAVRWARVTAHNFLENRALLRAGALTTTAFLALVPLLAIVFAFLKGAGFEALLRPLLLDRVPVLSPEAVDQLIRYIGRADAQAVGGVGFAALLISTWALLENIERSLNDIFGAPRTRSLVPRLGEYLAMLIVATILLALSVSLQTVLSSQQLLQQFLGDQGADRTTLVLLPLLPWLGAWGGFALLYAWMPNTRVPWRSILVGGFVGGTLFQLVQLGYLTVQLGFARYHAIYGALAQLPVLVVWIYLSWAVTLLGAEAAAQHRVLAAGGAPARKPEHPNLAWHVLGLVLAAFRDGGATPRPQELAVALGCPVGAVQRAVEPLIRARVLVEPSGDHGYLPARAPSSMSLEEVLGAIGAPGEEEGTS